MPPKSTTTTTAKAATNKSKDAAAKRKGKPAATKEPAKAKKTIVKPKPKPSTSKAAAAADPSPDDGDFRSFKLVAVYDSKMKDITDKILGARKSDMTFKNKTKPSGNKKAAGPASAASKAVTQVCRILQPDPEKKKKAPCEVSVTMTEITRSRPSHLKKTATYKFKQIYKEADTVSTKDGTKLNFNFRNVSLGKVEAADRK